MRRILLCLFAWMLGNAVSAQYSLTLTTYSQNFDGLGTTTQSPAGGNLNNVSATLNGWFFSESGTNANTTITAGTGSSATGDTYNFGAAAGSNRTLGGLLSGTLNPTFGFYLTNNTGSTILSLAISYTGETWRVGSAGRSDRLDFQYSTDATSLTTGTWTDYDALDYANPGQATGSGSVQHSASISSTLSSLSIANGATFFIRWNDFNATGSDDGMGVNDFSFTATLAPNNTITTNAVLTPPFNLANCAATASGTVNFTSTDIYNAGNVYTAYLSDDIGSFATPTNIGTLSSTANGSLSIPITIPAGTVSGTLYQIRVVSSNPAITGSASSAFTINQTGVCASSHTDYYRSITSGDWTDPTTWESSSDNFTTIISPATLAPTFNANTIEIRNGHTVTIDAASTADQLTIESGGILTHTNGVSFTLNDGAGTDMTINNGGKYILNGTQPAGSGTISVLSGAIVSVESNASPGDGDDFAFGNSNVTFSTGSIYEWATNTFTPSWAGRTYFTIGQNTTYRFSQSPNFSMGGTNPTFIYGTIEANANIGIQGSGTKTVTNGFLGTGNIDASASTGNLIINGATTSGSSSVLGGSGILTAPAAPQYLLNFLSNVAMTSNKTVSGDIQFGSPAYFDLGNYDLTVTGTITNTSSSSYIVTNGTGRLISTVANTASKVFPIGNTAYNPVTFTNNSGASANFNARVATGINNPPVAFPTYGVQRTWYLGASVVSNSVTTTFQYNAGELGTNLTTTDAVELLESDYTTWNILPGNTGLAQVGANPYTVTSATGLTINNSSMPYAIGKSGGWILPLDCIIACRAQKNNNSGFIHWSANSCAGVESFEVQRSVGNGAYSTIGIVHPNLNQLEFDFTDPVLASGTNLYRIKINTNTGATKYSNTVALIYNSNEILISSAAPNPTHNIATLTVSSAKSSKTEFTIFDITGNVVRKWQVVIADGNNLVNIDLSSLPSGTYQVLISNGTNSVVTHLLKQ